MDIEVHSKATIQKVAHDKPFVIISFVGTDDKWICPSPENCIGVLHTRCDDVDQDHGVGYKPITDQQAQGIVDFVMCIKDKVDIIFVHCEAGIGRSSAAAAAISMQLNGNPGHFLTGHGPNGKFCPNRTVLSKITQAFQSLKPAEVK